MKRKLKAISNRLVSLDIVPQIDLSEENNIDVMEYAAYIDHLNHKAFEEIENEYSKFNPNASAEEQIQFLKRILAIKNIVRELQDVHNDLAKSLYDKSELYIHDVDKISLNPKNILPQLQDKEPKEIVRASFYLLLENIKKNNTSLTEKEFNYINSLLMQIASRPEGIKLIVKLNYLLTKNDAQLVLKSSNSFACSFSLEGSAKSTEDFDKKSLDDLQTILKKETIPGEGAKRIRVGVDTRFNEKIPSLDLDVYASPGHGLTDGGPAFILLAHELIHGLHNLTGKARNNFEPFFQNQRYSEDVMLQLLYPQSSVYSYGDAAEEYWTIEGGVLCENSVRNEHGFFNRTGHLSAEPGAGGQAVLDLYYIGLARNYKQSTMDALAAHLTNAQFREAISEEDVIVERTLLLDKYQLLDYSLNDLVKIGFCVGPVQVKKAAEALQTLSKPTDDPQSNGLRLNNFLMNAPVKVAQLMVALLKTKDIDYSETVKSELSERQLHALQNLTFMLKNAGLPEHAVNALEQFSDGMREKFTAPPSLDMVN